MGAHKRFRLFMAGNQLGKTYAGGFETQCHLTGRYPPWWEGHRYETGIRCWASGVSNKATRERVQVMLLGEEPNWGTGMIPKDAIAERPVMNRAISGLVDYVLIKHVSGDISRLVFKSYEMKLGTFESDEIDFIWLDEEPPAKIHTACLARVTNTAGHIIITFTPLEGMSEVVRLFYPEPTSEQRWWVMMSIDEAHHIPESRRAEIIQNYPPHEREARTKGVPMLGSGRVFTHLESELACEPFEIPAHFARGNGMDLGYGDHPTAVAFLAHDRDSDVLYLTDTYKNDDVRVAIHADAIRMRPDWIPCFYPHDAYKRDGSGESYADLYRQKGVRMYTEHATFPDGGYNVEPGIIMLDERMGSGRFRVFAHCHAWFEEYRTYHRKEGLIVPKFDDLLDATRIGAMMVRGFRTEPTRLQQGRAVSYNVLDPYGLSSRH